MEKTWGRNRSGYVFFPWIKGDCKDRDARRKNYNEGPAFYWPRDKGKIKAHLQKHTNDDVYWCPSLFERNRRIEPYASPELALWADLDEVDPETIDPDYRPTMAWESSPGRYQAVWLLTKELVGASWMGKENHRLTAYLGADPSGWDTTQLLRVPGWRNHKPEYREKKGGPVQGRILWGTGPRYMPDHFDDLPEVQMSVVAEEALDEEIESVDAHEAWGRVRLKVPKQIRDYIRARDTAGADRSDVLWQIERELADAGCTLSEIVAIVRPTVWNKYRDRNDELKRLRIESSRAISQRPDSLEGAIEEVHEPKPDLELLTGPTWGEQPRPKWLVEGIWREGACGFIAGDPKSYKSWVALDLAISVASGDPFLGVFPIKQPGPVILIEEEDRQGEVESRAVALFNERSPWYHPHGWLEHEGAAVYWSPPQPLRLYKAIGKGFQANDAGWQEWLVDQIAETGAKLVVIDTLGTTAGGVDLDRGAEVLNAILNPLKQAAHEHDCALAIVHHNRKSGDATGGRRMLGSHHLHGWTEDALFFRPPDKGRVIIERESKATRLEPLTLEVPRMYNLEQGGAFWQPMLEGSGDGAESSHSDDTGDDDKKSQGRSGTRREALAPNIVVSMVTAGMAIGKVYKSADISESLDKSRSAVSRQLKRAEELGWVKKVDDGWVLLDK